MRISELLNAMASWLASPNNEAMLLAENDENCIRIVAESCVLAAELLKRAADEVDTLEPATESLITSESIDDTAALAAAFDASNDPQLKKMASVLDELLLTLAAPPNALAQKKMEENYRIEELRKKYQQPREDLKLSQHNSESLKAIDKSNFTKEYKLNQHPLSTRGCPLHPGAQLARIGEHLFQCELDKKVYDYENGYDLNGEHVPGGNVALQTSNSTNIPGHSLFDTRDGRLGNHS
jgi:hypothetical protein